MTMQTVFASGIGVVAVYITTAHHLQTALPLAPSFLATLLPCQVLSPKQDG